MSDKLKDKVAVITGGGSGIGLATVMRFLDEGARVVASDLRQDRGEDALAVAAEKGHADNLRFKAADVTKEDEIEALVAHAVAEFGRLDCMFNNAGIMGAVGTIDKVKAEDWDFTFNVLVRGVFFGIKHAARIMLAQEQGGSIINTGSVASFNGGCGPHAYTASKAAVLNMSKSAARELAAHKIRVNALCPGAVSTPLSHRGNQEIVDSVLIQTQPLKIVGRPEHMAAAVSFLASDDAEFITGTSLVVDGGLTGASMNTYNGEFDLAFPDGGLDLGSTTL